jgi:hypothetical protein
MHLFFLSHHLRKNIGYINLKFQLVWDYQKY